MRKQCDRKAKASGLGDSLVCLKLSSTEGTSPEDIGADEDIASSLETFRKGPALLQLFDGPVVVREKVVAHLQEHDVGAVELGLPLEFP